MEDKISINVLGEVRQGMSVNTMRASKYILDFKTCSYCKVKYDKICLCQSSQKELDDFRKLFKIMHITPISLSWANKVRALLQDSKETRGVYESYGLLKHRLHELILSAYRDEIRITLSYLDSEKVSEILKKLACEGKTNGLYK